MSSYQSFVPLRIVVLGMNRSWGRVEWGKKKRKKKKRRRKKKDFFLCIEGKGAVPQSTFVPSRHSDTGKDPGRSSTQDHPFHSDTKPISSHLTTFTNESVYSADRPRHFCKVISRGHSQPWHSFSLCCSFLPLHFVCFDIRNLTDDWLRLKYLSRWRDRLQMRR